MTTLTEGAGSYAARRLLRTETARATEQAGLAASEMNPFVAGRRYLTSHQHVGSDECDTRAHASSEVRGEAPQLAPAPDVPLSLDDARAQLSARTTAWATPDRPPPLVEDLRTDQQRELIASLLASGMLTPERAAYYNDGLDRLPYMRTGLWNFLRYDLKYGSYEHTKGITIAEKYQAGFFMDTNNLLRLGEVDKAETWESIHLLDAALAANTLPGPLMVYRGVPGTGPHADLYRGMAVGDVWSDKAFLSTTLSRDIAEKFAGEKSTETADIPETTWDPDLVPVEVVPRDPNIRDIVFEFTVPEGTPGLYLSADKFGDPIYRRQEEVLLPRDMQFVVTGNEPPNAEHPTHSVIRMSLIPKEDHLPLYARSEPPAPAGWQPEMTAEAAQRWVSGSQITAPYYHGTTAGAADAIRDEGFSPDRWVVTDMFPGRGTYLSADQSYADAYGSGKGGATLQTYVNVRSVIDSDAAWALIPEQYDPKYTPEEEAAGKFGPLRATELLQSQGYDAIRYQHPEAGRDTLMVFDPRRIVVAEGEPPRLPLSPEKAEAVMKKATAEWLAPDVPPTTAKEWGKIATREELLTKLDALTAKGVMPQSLLDHWRPSIIEERISTAEAVDLFEGLLKHGTSQHTADIEAMQTYQNGSFMNLNTRLRTGDKLSAYDQDKITALDAALATTTIPNTITVYRGVPRYALEGSPLDGLQVGNVFRDPGFLSTSLDRKIAVEFTDEILLDDPESVPVNPNPSYIFEFVVPKGSHGLFVGVPDFGKGGALKEREVVLPRNLEFKVVEAVEANREHPDHRVIKLALVPAGTTPPPAPPPPLSHDKARYALSDITEAWLQPDRELPDPRGYDAEKLKGYLEFTKKLKIIPEDRADDYLQKLRDGEASVSQIAYSVYNDTEHGSYAHTVARRIVQEYQDGEFMDLNLKARAGEALNVRERGRAEQLEAALETVRTPAPMKVYRGIEGSALAGSPLAGLKVGDLYEDPGFMSTSLSRDIAVDFMSLPHPPGTKKPPALLFEINVPQDHPGLFMGVEAFGENHAVEEEELLLPRGLRFKVAEVKPAGGDQNYSIVTLDIVPKDAAPLLAAKSEPARAPAPAPRPAPLPGYKAGEVLGKATKQWLQPDIPTLDWDSIADPAELERTMNELVAAGSFSRAEVDHELAEMKAGRQGFYTTIEIFAERGEFGSEHHTNAIRAVNSYQDGAYMSINARVRKGTSPDGLDALKMGELDAALATTVIPEPILVYRGVPGYAVKDTPLAGLKAGDVYEDLGFMSTTLNLEVAQSFTEGVFGAVDGPNAVFEIYVPGGHSGLFLGVDDFGSGGALEEFEVLLPRNTKFQVTKVVPPGGDHPHNSVVRMEIIADAASLKPAPPPPDAPAPKTFGEQIAANKQKAAALGVTIYLDNATLKQRFTMSGRVLSAMEELSSRGMAVPVDVIATDVGEEFPGSPADVIATTDPQTGGIFLNTANDYWKNPVAAQKALGESGWHSSDNPNHIIWHETAHALMATGDPTQVKKLQSAKLNPEERKLALEQVSRYAVDTPMEFIAEVYAGRLAGKEYSDEVMAMYRKYQGPEIKEKGG